MQLKKMDRLYGLVELSPSVRSPDHSYPFLEDRRIEVAMFSTKKPINNSYPFARGRPLDERIIIEAEHFHIRISALSDTAYEFAMHI